MKIHFSFSIVAAFAGYLATSEAQDSFPEPYNTEKGEVELMSAQETAATAETPPGFRVEVFASEPDVQQPIAIDFDDSGRLWVAECYTFAEQPLRWDLNLRDRIVVLEDTDKDGKSDKRTVFWDKGTRLTSVAVGRGGVYALCSPQLLFIPDIDGDLVPDGEPQVVLDGFDAETIGHNVVNGLKWGPDGWLYGRHGITATSLVGVPGTPEARRTALNCSIWRFHPVTFKFEVFSNGGTNPWGLDWDENGQLFYTNTVIGHLWHGIPGAYFTRMFGVHLNQSIYELIPHTADHYHWDTGAESWNDIRKGITSTTDQLGGGHAHTGCLIYQGGVWPEEYRGKLFTLNYHGRRLNMENLEREGVGYVATHAPDFVKMKDPWFRGLDLITGPDGQVWVCDWSDTGECHDNDGIHRTSGRIYRIVYDGADAGKPGPARPEWLSTGPGEIIGKDQIEKLLTSGEESKVAMGVRWLAAEYGEKPETRDRLLAIAGDNPPGLVRLELAAALQRLPIKDRLGLAAFLCSVGEDADDRQQPLMVWYGINDAVSAHTDEILELALQSKLPTVIRLIARRFSESMDVAPEPIDLLLSRSLKSGDQSILHLVLEGMSEGLSGWAKAPEPKSWKAVVEEITRSADEPTQEIIKGLSVLFGDGRAREELIAIVGDKEGDAAARRAALKSLLRQPDAELLTLLRPLINDRDLAIDVIRGMVNFDAPDIPKRLLTSFKRRPAYRDAAIDTLVARANYASALLDAVEEGTVSADDITPFQARQIQSLGDAKLNQRLSDLWGELRATPEAKLAEILDWKKKLTPEVLEQGDAAKGKIVFTQTCGACHKLYGEGGALGPDLTGSDRHNLDYLLSNIINPNDVVPADYRLTIFTLKDGRVISGVVPEENDRSITVQGPAEQFTFEKSEIEKRETMPVSLMPEGLLSVMGEAGVRDLVAYLMSSGKL